MFSGYGLEMLFPFRQVEDVAQNFPEVRAQFKAFVSDVQAKDRQQRALADIANGKGS